MRLNQLRLYDEIAVGFENLDGKIDFGSFFGRLAPVHIEIGAGKGTFLLNQARLCPDIDFFGVEWANKYYRYTVDRLGRWGVTNVRMIRADAGELVHDYFPDQAIDCYHIYFPDPWPKKRHNKRRFFCDENLDQILRTLKPAGVVNLATDHEDYYSQMCRVLDRAFHTGRMERIDFIRPAFTQDGQQVGTNYEQKYLKEGRKTYTIAAQKIW